MARGEPVVIHEDGCELEGWADPAEGPVRWRTLLSGDRTASHALTLGVAELAPGHAHTFRPHQHTQPEVYYVLAGEGVVHIAGAEHPVRPGSAVFVPGDAPHGARNTGQAVLRILYAFPTDSFRDVAYRFPET